MKGLKKLAIASIPAVMFLFGAASNASANHDGLPLTPAEKTTVTMANDFKSCVQNKLSAVTQDDIDSYVHGLLIQGIPAVPALIQELVQNEFVGKASNACVTEMSIDVTALTADVHALVKKHGRGVLAAPAPQ